MAILYFCNHIRDRFEYATYEDNMGNFGTLSNKDDLPAVGDIVCSLRRSIHKFILRPEEDEWRIVGITTLSKSEREGPRNQLSQFLDRECERHSTHCYPLID